MPAWRNVFPSDDRQDVVRGSADVSHQQDHTRDGQVAAVVGWILAISLTGFPGGDAFARNPGDEPAPPQDVLVVTGAEGTPEYGQQFRQWAERWRIAAESAEARFRLLGQDESEDDRKTVVNSVRELSTISNSEPLWIVLIGHGTYDGRSVRFNLRGADITAEDIAGLLADARRPIALINCASCSAPFINAVSGPDRVIITATKDGGQFQFARFGDAMSAAMIGLEADLDQDGQVSLLEAWALASHRTAEFYESSGRLATEHALLDDSGDGRGSRAALFSGVQLRPPEDEKTPDGRLARRWHLVRSAAERQLTAEQRQQRDRLEAQLESLKRRRDEFVEADYLDQLESILLPLAELYESVSASHNSDVGEGDGQVPARR